MRDLYTQVLMDHHKRPRNHGKIEDAAVEERLLNPLCGDEVTVYASLKDGRISVLRFEGRGCSISQASASMMTERLTGKNLDEAQAEISGFEKLMVGEGEFPEGDDLAALKGVIQYPSRIRCATLAWHALEKGLNDADKP